MVQILVCQMNPVIGDLHGNCAKIIRALERAGKQKAQIVLFPELALCGYCPEDLLFRPHFVEQMEKMLDDIRPFTEGMFVALGLARKNPSGKEKPFYNSAAVFREGSLLGFKDKTLLPTYDVFDERRFFEPSLGKEPVWEFSGLKIAITICEDVWTLPSYHRNPIQELEGKGVHLHLNLSGSPYSYEKKKRREKVFQTVCKTLRCPSVFCNQVGANDQLVFDGYSFCLNGEGELMQEAAGFQEEEMLIHLGKAPVRASTKSPIEDLYSALVLGVKDYFRKQGFQKAVVGLSGGIDSALVACIAKDALGPNNVLCLMLPSRFSSRESQEDATMLAQKLGVEIQTISIDEIFGLYLATLHPHFSKRKEETEENLQSRIRGMILMAFSNQLGHLLLNTGNKSEMAMGYCTLYGDMAGALGVLQDVFKCRVYELARHVGHIPTSILQKAPSAELKEGQKDEDTLPPYELLDPVLEDLIEKGLSREEICKKRGCSSKFVQEIEKKIDLAEFKRRQAPISIRVSEKAFSKGRTIPIVQREGAEFA